MTYRERREARAERLRGWADKRQRDASATLAANEALPYRHDIAFLTQPGHIPARARLNASEDRAFASLAKAAGMNARADSIERAADDAIYSDDPDAAERLRERIASLEAERERMTAANAAYRKAHRAELAAMTPYARGQAVPYPSYALSNLSGNLGRQKARLEQIGNPKARVRLYWPGRGDVCRRCGERLGDHAEPYPTVRTCPV